MSDMRGKVVVVTGATSGIGKEAAKRLAAMKAKVIVHGRDEARCRAALSEIVSSTGNRECETRVADFSSLGQVRSLGEELAERFERIDVLIDNAGLYSRQFVVTKDGIELTFQVNQVAPFLLTNLLLDRLIAAAPSRIVVVSSVAHRSAYVDLDNLEREVRGQTRYDAYQAYALSKFANIAFAYELASRLQGTGVTVNAVHPGTVGTKLLRQVRFPMGMSPERGADPLVYLATSPEVEDVTGRYFNREREDRTIRPTYRDNVRQRIWELCEELCLVHA